MKRKPKKPCPWPWCRNCGAMVGVRCRKCGRFGVPSPEFKKQRKSRPDGAGDNRPKP